MVREFDKIVGEDNLDYVLNSGELTDEAKRTLVAVEAFVRLNQGEYDDCV